MQRPRNAGYYVDIEEKIKMSGRVQIENRRYTGSKAQLIDWIFSLIKRECSGDTFADIFSGTGIVAAAASKKFKHIILNDFLYSNYAIYQGFFGVGSWSESKIQRLTQKYNNINANKLKRDYFSHHFGGRYFHSDTAKKIGYIRADLERQNGGLTKKEYYMLLTSLLYATDKIANTVGHYDAFLRTPPKKTSLLLKLIEPIFPKKVEILRKDANQLVKHMRADVVYIDPPYNSRQYSRFYHVLETLTKWDRPSLHGVALKPLPENISDYCKVSARSTFAELIKDLDCKHIVVSYNNTYISKSHSSRNKISLEDIRNVLKAKGKTKAYKIKHRFFNTGKTDFKDHHELLFITKVK